MRQRLFLTPYPKSLLIGELSAPLTARLLFESPCRLRDFHKRVRKCNLSGLSGHLPYQGRQNCELRPAGSSRASLYLFYDDVDDLLRYDDEFDYFLIADEFLDVR